MDVKPVSEEVAVAQNAVSCAKSISLSLPASLSRTFSTKYEKSLPPLPVAGKPGESAPNFGENEASRLQTLTRVTFHLAH